MGEGEEKEADVVPSDESMFLRGMRQGVTVGRGGGETGTPGGQGRVAGRGGGSCGYSGRYRVSRCNAQRYSTYAPRGLLAGE